MPSSNVEKLYSILDALEKAGKDKKEIKAIRKLIDSGNLSESLARIRKLNSSSGNFTTAEKNEKTAKGPKGAKTAKSNKESEKADTAQSSKKDRKNEKLSPSETSKSTKSSEESEKSDTSETSKSTRGRRKIKKVVVPEDMDDELEGDVEEDSGELDDGEFDEDGYGDEYYRDADYGEDDFDDGYGESDSENWDDSEDNDFEGAKNMYRQDEDDNYDGDDDDDVDSSKAEGDGEDGADETSKSEDEDNDDDDDYEEDFDDDEDKDFFGDEKVKPKYKEEVKKVESPYPEKLRDEGLEKAYVGLLLNNPKLIVKYYILFNECYFDDQSMLNIYKSILFTEGGNYTPEIAKKGFNFSVDNNETFKQKQMLKFEIGMKKYNPEKVYNELKKLCVLRKSYLEEPRKEIQDQIVNIRDYELYDQMSADEVKAAVVQVSEIQKFKQAVLSEGLTDFLEKGENNLTNGLELPFPILSSVFKGIRKGETMAFAMPSNAGKSRFTIDIASYTAFVHKKKVLVISNEMSEEKMRLCLITTVLNNPEIQKLHGQKLSKTEGELLEFKFRPDKDAKVKVDEDGFVLQEEKETRQEFVERLKKISSEFTKTIAVTDWVNSQMNNSIYFINITDHTNDELKKVIMNFYYKEKIEYVFYDTLKTDTANIGNGEEIKRTATILSNLAQNFNMFICSTLQLTESTTLPINLTINDLAVSRTVKEVLDTLCLIKQIMREDLNKYEYSLNEVDTKFFELEKFKDPDVRYYACVVDKNRAGAKPKVLFRLNLAYNIWNELGYLRLKTEE